MARDVSRLLSDEYKQRHKINNNNENGGGAARVNRADTVSRLVSDEYKRQRAIEEYEHRRDLERVAADRAAVAQRRQRREDTARQRALMQEIKVDERTPQVNLADAAHRKASSKFAGKLQTVFSDYDYNTDYDACHYWEKN